MTHTEKRTECDEWEVEICDDCGHDLSYHHDEPKEVYNSDGTLMYTAIGCTVLESDGRIMNTNPYPYLRCSCMHSK